MTKYPLLLARLLKVTSPSPAAAQERAAIREARARIEAALEQMNKVYINNKLHLVRETDVSE